MDAKSLDMLEFPRIREMISGYAAFSGGREMAAELRPLTDYPAITHLLAQTAEARELLSLDRSFTVGDVTDIREHARLAEKEGILDPAVLLEVRSCLTALHELVRALKEHAEDHPLLWEIASGSETMLTRSRLTAADTEPTSCSEQSSTISRAI